MPKFYWCPGDTCKPACDCEQAQTWATLEATIENMSSLTRAKFDALTSNERFGNTVPLTYFDGLTADDIKDLSVAIWHFKRISWEGELMRYVDQDDAFNEITDIRKRSNGCSIEAMAKRITAYQSRGWGTWLRWPWAYFDEPTSNPLIDHPRLGLW